YELDGERYLFVFDPADPGIGGKGDIYAAETFHRLVRWTARVSEDHKHGRASSVDSWLYYSAWKHRFITNIDTLIAQLRSTLAHDGSPSATRPRSAWPSASRQTPDQLDLSYRSLDVVSEHVQRLGVERAQQELYDQLVAYVGEALRLRIQGRWEV